MAGDDRYFELSGDPLDADFTAQLSSRRMLMTGGLTMAFAAVATPSMSAALIFSLVTASMATAYSLQNRFADRELYNTGLDKKTLCFDRKKDQVFSQTNVAHKDKARGLAKQADSWTQIFALGGATPLVLSLDVFIPGAAMKSNDIFHSLFLIAAAHTFFSLALFSRRMAKNFNDVADNKLVIVERPKPKKKEVEQGEGKFAPHVREWLRSLGRGKRPALHAATVNSAPKLALAG